MKKIVATLLAALATIAPAPTKAAPEEVDDHIKIIAVLDGLGIQLSSNDQFVCKEKGWKGGYNTDGSILVVCTEGASQEDRFNTLRHEAWHVYQDLRDCSLADTGRVVPVFLQGVVPDDLKEWTAERYPVSLVPSEAEAFWAADVFEPEVIAKLLFFQAKSCGYKL